MKRNDVITLMLSLFFCISYDAKAQEKWQKEIVNPDDVESYFMLLNKEHIFCDGEIVETYKSREELITKCDLKNGYIEYLASGKCVLFKNRKKGIDIIAIEQLCTQGSNCSPVNGFFTYDKSNRTWRRQDVFPYDKVNEVLEELLGDNDFCLRLKLPQFGTKIIAFVEHDPRISIEVKWNGEQFIL
ncbi:hypothetical protein [Persicobacter sp. CCB-QB2]|uniref:hypothetical protein n=1 Tax=Persicobacter sp. CCB-QB2 TaxID=1561025 RepID=UPI0012F8EE07|nr:hypothetical protein [Persicobacter sp. CCB-QB2]